MTDQHYICVAGIARAGTTQLRKVMSRLPGLTSYGEIFHRHRGMSLSPEDIEGFSARVGLAFPGGQRDINLVAATHAHPEALLDVIRKRVGLMTFKLYPSDLDRNDVRRLIERPDLTLICLSRRPIDCYISTRTAALAAVSGDNPENRIELKYGHFRRWYESQRDWYGFLAETVAAAGKPMISMTYEDDIRQPEAALLSILHDRLRQNGIDLATPSIPTEEATPPRALPKAQSQDCTTRLRNWEEFSAKLRAGGLFEAAFSPFALAAE